jgi:hypothetical protein
MRCSAALGSAGIPRNSKAPAEGVKGGFVIELFLMCVAFVVVWGT